jgi:hypothetical protein
VGNLLSWENGWKLALQGALVGCEQLADCEHPRTRNGHISTIILTKIMACFSRGL